jgi:hypothetical protein
MKLSIHPTVKILPANFEDRVDDVVGALAEFTHMPRDRRAERVHSLAPELLAVAVMCDGVTPADMLQGLVEVDGYALQLADGLQHLDCPSRNH